MSRPDIRRPEAVDAAWLTAALQAAEVDAVVSDFAARPIGAGQIGDTWRFRLRYARGGETAPATLVGKFPSANPDSFRTGVAAWNYVREVRFYQQLAATALIATPRWYMAEIDERTSEFVLLMEDLAPAEQGDQLKGVSLDQARQVMDEAAKLHASHWNDAALDDLPWIWASRTSPIPQSPADTVRGVWRAFADRYDGRLSGEVVETGRRFTAVFERYRAWPQGPRCLTHFDFRPDNMMFATAAGGRPVTVLDWQSLGYATGTVDVAYFLAGALTPGQRRAHQPELLARYHQGLVRLGVRDYDAADLRRDYAMGGFRLLMTAFMAGMAVKQTERGDAMFIQMADAATAHIRDNAALDLLGA
jgi:aminoglycoside phosphotransferase (APT) family kinase protein